MPSARSMTIGLILACADQLKNVYSRFRRRISSVVRRSVVTVMRILRRRIRPQPATSSCLAADTERTVRIPGTFRALPVGAALVVVALLAVPSAMLATHQPTAEDVVT